jgi:hypothetical protein
MESKNLNVRLVKLPSDTELILFILKEDLKNTKLMASKAQGSPIVFTGGILPHWSSVTWDLPKYPMISRSFMQI